jgi:hypothetical protein
MPDELAEAIISEMMAPELSSRARAFIDATTRGLTLAEVEL